MYILADCMMIIHKNISGENLIWIKLLSFFFLKQYVLHAKYPHYIESSKIKNLEFIKFDHLKYSYNNFDFPDKGYCINFAKKYFAKKTLENYQNYFPKISFFAEKIIASFCEAGANYYHQNVALSIFLRNKPNQKIIIINSNLNEYTFRNFGLFNRKNVIHICLIKMPSLSYKKFRNFVNLKKSAQLITKNKSNKKKQVGIIFHEKRNKFFTKKHFEISSNKNSILSKYNLRKYLINNSCEKQNISNLTMKKSGKIIYKSFWKSLFEIGKIKSVKNLLGLYFLTKKSIEIQSWEKSLKEINLKKIIYDFDVLVPKAFALASQSVGIKSYAMQERPMLSFNHGLYGVIVDIYLFAGKVYKKYGEKNLGIFFKKGINFGMWRTSIFYERNINKIFKTFCLKKKIYINEFNKIVVFFGFWHGSSVNQTPLINPFSSKQFYDAIELVASQSAKNLIIVRMKNLNPGDKKIIGDRFKNYRNVFLCDDYKTQNISYSLAKAADLILSVQTSLVEESLVFGKKVLVFDYFSHSQNLCRKILPKEFHFILLRSLQELAKKIKIFLNDNKKVSKQFLRLQNRISGGVAFGDSRSLNRILENILIKYA